MLSLCVCGTRQGPWHIVVELEEKRLWQPIRSEQRSHMTRLDAPCFVYSGEADCRQHIALGPHQLPPAREQERSEDSARLVLPTVDVTLVWLYQTLYRAVCTRDRIVHSSYLALNCPVGAHASGLLSAWHIVRPLV